MGEPTLLFGFVEVFQNPHLKERADRRDPAVGFSRAVFRGYLKQPRDPPGEAVTATACSVKRSSPRLRLLAEHAVDGGAADAVAHGQRAEALFALAVPQDGGCGRDRAACV